MSVKTKTTVTCIGKQEPSKEAVDRFIEIYLEMVEANQKRLNEKTS
ncbi:hypothetical protein ACIQD3_22535 [Peribacillus loiseleuriae]